jgi:hypothetical protein
MVMTTNNTPVISYVNDQDWCSTFLENTFPTAITIIMPKDMAAAAFSTFVSPFINFLILLCGLSLRSGGKHPAIFRTIETKNAFHAQLLLWIRLKIRHGFPLLLLRHLKTTKYNNDLRQIYAGVI